MKMLLETKCLCEDSISMMPATIARAYLAVEMKGREVRLQGTESAFLKNFFHAWEVVSFQARGPKEEISSLGPIWPWAGTHPLCSEDPDSITSELNLSGLSRKPFLRVNKFSHA